MVHLWSIQLKCCEVKSCADFQNVSWDPCVLFHSTALVFFFFFFYLNLTEFMDNVMILIPSMMLFSQRVSRMKCVDFSLIINYSSKRSDLTWTTNDWIVLLRVQGKHKTSINTCWKKKNSICWLGMFWSMAAGLSWSLAGHELVPGADWPSGEPGEFPVAWQQIWPTALHLFYFFIIYYYYFILLLLLFLLPTECNKVIFSEFAIQ